jgi:hypothetical protein
LTEKPPIPSAAAIAVIPIGLALTIIGVTLDGAGALRFVLMGAGLLLQLVALLILLQRRGTR